MTVACCKGVPREDFPEGVLAASTHVDSFHVSVVGAPPLAAATTSPCGGRRVSLAHF